MTSLLLISSSNVHGRGYLDHVEEAMREFLAGVSELIFLPYALHDPSAYTARARERFARLGIAVASLHEAPDPRRAIEAGSAFFVGGGNTFRLLKAVQDLRLVGALYDRVLAGARYIGSSAGTNLACPTIRTTNDMPIVSPVSLDALGLVPFQINAHYLDPDPDSRHRGETREERISQFHEEPENIAPVIGLRESCWLLRRGDSLVLQGLPGPAARVFVRAEAPKEYGVGVDLSNFLMS